MTTGGREPAALITKFVDSRDRPSVVQLWESVFAYESPHNAPDLAIDRKLAIDDELFLVAYTGDVLVGTVMGGYDGHRGWIYALAVREEGRRSGVGSALMAEVERRLVDLGCVKVNLQVHAGNEDAVRFYERCGYTVQARVSLGKRLR